MRSISIVNEGPLEYQFQLRKRPRIRNGGDTKVDSCLLGSPKARA